MKKIKDEIFLINIEKKGESVALFYPNDYYTGSNNLGFHKIFEKLNSFNFSVKRFFYSENRVLSLDCDNNLKDFPFIFVSISFENDLINLIHALSISGINLNKRLRNNNPEIIIGGAAVLLNPYIYMLFSDYVFLGEIDSIDSFEVLISKSLNSNLIYNQFYLFNKKNEKNVYQNIFKNFTDLFKNKLVSYNLLKPAYSTYLNINDKKFYFNIEYSRGCKFNCKFCNYWIFSSKYRIFDYNYIYKLIEKGIKWKKDIGIISASPPEIDFIKELAEKFNKINFHFSSFRIDERNIELIEYYKKFNIRTITIAPETLFTEDRKILNKNFSNEDIEEFLKNAKQNSINKFKFYFIIGLFEDEEYKFESFINRFYKLLKGSIVKFSINPFIRKSFTIIKNKIISNDKYEIITKNLQNIFYKKGIKADFLPYEDALIQYNISNIDIFYEKIDYFIEKFDFIDKKIIKKEKVQKSFIKGIFLN